MSPHHFGGEGGYCNDEDDGSSLSLSLLSFLSWPWYYAIASYILLFYSNSTKAQQNIRLSYHQQRNLYSKKSGNF